MSEKSRAPASMTGFARASGTLGPHGWAWEIRSVNGRGLDLRLRLPGGFEALEPQARALVAGRLSRGNVSATLSVDMAAEPHTVRLNALALEAVISAAESIRHRLGGPTLTVEGALRLPGVLEAGEAGEDGEAARAPVAGAALEGLATALDGLIAMRRREGQALTAVLLRHLETIEGLVDVAEASPARTPEAVRTRLEADVRRLVAADAGLDAGRLHQEAVLLATRADIQEELDRLRAHIAQARQLLADGGPVGRRLDFLAQEFGREANTLCAKSNDVAITRAGLDLKATIEQLREQIQNLE